MAKAIFTFLSVKTVAYGLVFVQLLGGLAEIIGASVYIGSTGCFKTALRLYEDCVRTTLIVTIILGIYTIYTGILLAVGVFKDNHRYVFVSLVLGIVNLLIVTIYTGVNVFVFPWLFFILLLCVVCWYGHLCLYNLYQDLLPEKGDPVIAGVAEIAYNANNCHDNSAMAKEDAF